MTATTELSKPIKCRRCAGTGDYMTGRECFRCNGSGVVEGDRAKLAAGKARSERRIAASRALDDASAGLSRNDLWLARQAFGLLERDEAERFDHCVASLLAGDPRVVPALLAYAATLAADAA